MFLKTIQDLVLPDGRIVFLDNNFVKGSNLHISNQDTFANTYQIRKLEDGTNHMVLKNFPDQEIIRQHLNGFAKDIRFINLKYY